MDLHPLWTRCTAAVMDFAFQSCFSAKQQVNEGLTLHAPMERASNENECNHQKQGAGARGFTLDQCSEVGNRNLDTREAAKCIGESATTQLPHLEAAFLIFMLETTSTES